MYNNLFSIGDICTVVKNCKPNSEEISRCSEQLQLVAEHGSGDFHRYVITKQNLKKNEEYACKLLIVSTSAPSSSICLDARFERSRFIAKVNKSVLYAVPSRHAISHPQTALISEDDGLAFFVTVTHDKAKANCEFTLEGRLRITKPVPKGIRLYAYADPLYDGNLVRELLYCVYRFDLGGARLWISEHILSTRTQKTIQEATRRKVSSQGTGAFVLKLYNEVLNVLQWAFKLVNATSVADFNDEISTAVGWSERYDENIEALLMMRFHGVQMHFNMHVTDADKTDPQNILLFPQFYKHMRHLKLSNHFSIKEMGEKQNSCDQYF